MATMLIGGLWHGAAWTFVFWGGLHGLYLAIAAWWKAAADRRNWQLPPYVGWLVTFLAVVVAWVFFRATTFSGASTILAAMFAIGDADIPSRSASFMSMAVADNNVAGPWIVVIGLLIAVTAPNVYQLFRRFRPALDIYGHVRPRKRARKPADIHQRRPKSIGWFAVPRSQLVPLAMAVAVLLIVAMATFWQSRGGSYSEFIYFNF